eukprot:6174536-Pleurochrysis_carterae.AAC.1
MQQCVMVAMRHGTVRIVHRLHIDSPSPQSNFQAKRAVEIMSKRHLVTGVDDSSFISIRVASSHRLICVTANTDALASPCMIAGSAPLAHKVAAASLGHLLVHVESPPRTDGVASTQCRCAESMSMPFDECTVRCMAESHDTETKLFNVLDQQCGEGARALARFALGKVEVISSEDNRQAEPADRECDARVEGCRRIQERLRNVWHQAQRENRSEPTNSDGSEYFARQQRPGQVYPLLAVLKFLHDEHVSCSRQHRMPISVTRTVGCVHNAGEYNC